jgi:phytoene synthase
MPPGMPSSTTAYIRRIRWAAWFSICAAIAMPSGRSFPITPAQRCSWRISGKTFRATLKKGASTFRWTRWPLTEADIVERRFGERYVSLMKDLITRTRELFAAGMPLVGRVEGPIRIDIEMFSRGGLAILDAIESSGYDTLNRRPALTKWTQVRLLTRALAGRATSKDRDERAVTREGAPRQTLSESGTSTTRSDAAEGVAITVSDSYAECNRIARGAHSSFYLAFFGLPRDKRNALFALYAFMRLIDNVSDEPGDLEAKRRGLARWRGMLDEAIAGDASGHAILPALADSITRFKIPTRYFHDLILGAEMDLTVATYATFDQLSEYCYRVAGTVGLTCLHVFGFRDPRDPDLAERLGLAFQLTNIIRDVKADLEMGRVYLPQEDLERFGCTKNDLQGPLTQGVQALLEFEAERAWRFYEEGVALIGQIDADSRATLWALVRTYSTLLARMEECHFDVFSSRVSLSSAEKVQYLLAAGLAVKKAGWWKGDALAKRPGNRRRPGGPVLRHRAG